MPALYGRNRRIWLSKRFSEEVDDDDEDDEEEGEEEDKDADVSEACVEGKLFASSAVVVVSVVVLESLVSVSRCLSPYSSKDE